MRLALRLSFAGLVCALFAPSGNAQEQTLLLLKRVWSDGPTRPYSDCLKVERDGSYRLEHTSGQSEKTQIHVGAFNDQEMKHLGEMLDDPALESLTTPNPGQAGVTGADVWWIAITRATDPVQHLWFSTPIPGSSSGDRSPALDRTPAMQPLVHWYKQMSKRKR